MVKIYKVQGEEIFYYVLYSKTKQYVFLASLQDFDTPSPRFITVKTAEARKPIIKEYEESDRTTRKTGWWGSN
mgnify:CR=1 FL=1|tara:strand:+ start:39 stop:257 length:219 start_codon:yes stop_codon:yes gene_type:complete